MTTEDLTFPLPSAPDPRDETFTWITDARETPMSGSHELVDPATIADILQDTAWAVAREPDAFHWFRVSAPGGARWAQGHVVEDGFIHLELSDPDADWPREVRPLASRGWTQRQAAHIIRHWVQYGMLRQDLTVHGVPRPV